MPQYLVAGYLPDNYDPSSVDEATGAIHALNEEIVAAGIGVFVGGLRLGMGPGGNASSEVYFSR